MPLSRAAIAKNKRTHQIKDAVNNASKKLADLESVCSKHSVGSITIRNCKMATADGKTTFIEHSDVKANMRASIMIVKADSIAVSETSIYDLVEIEKNKKERDQKKYLEDLEKSKQEIEKMKNTQNLDSVTSLVDDSNPEHKNLLLGLIESSKENKIASEPASTETTPTETTPTETTPTESTTTAETTSTESKQPVEDSQAEKPVDEKSAEAKRQRALDQMKKELHKKATAKGKNKYYRNCWADFNDKFVLIEQPDYKYLEIKVDAAEMVIDNARVYKLSMPATVKEIYYLVVGDLQTKSSLIRHIDPNYKSEKVFKDHEEFMERIKANENVKTQIKEETLEIEKSDIDFIGMPEKPSDDKTSDDKTSDENPVV